MAGDVRVTASASAHQSFKTWTASGVRRVIAMCANVTSERRRLRDLSDRDLRDIGLTRGDAEREARRGFWDLPHGR